MPLTKLDASDARNSTACATSFGDPGAAAGHDRELAIKSCHGTIPSIGPDGFEAAIRRRIYPLGMTRSAGSGSA
ncbi:hypothetical protein [Novosphingobium sp.]|uniref:hypothetical protein n=1 Tax=Novosphingobium sp. TaxID=1874826 RepID=UPI002FDD3FB6